jgi:hypothetical protein
MVLATARDGARRQQGVAAHLHHSPKALLIPSEAEKPSLETARVFVFHGVLLGEVKEGTKPNNLKEPKKQMKTIVALTAAIAMMLVVRSSTAGENASSSRAALLGKQAEVARQTTSYVQAATTVMACAAYKNVSAVINRPVGTKPGFRTEEVRVSVHQCASCSDKMMSQLKQTKLVHTCAAGSEARPDTCASMPVQRVPGA